MLSENLGLIFGLWVNLWSLGQSLVFRSIFGLWVNLWSLGLSLVFCLWVNLWSLGLSLVFRSDLLSLGLIFSL